MKIEAISQTDAITCKRGNDTLLLDPKKAADVIRRDTGSVIRDRERNRVVFVVPGPSGNPGDPWILKEKYWRNHSKFGAKDALIRDFLALSQTIKNFTPPLHLPLVATFEEEQVARGNMVNLMGGEGSREARKALIGEAEIEALDTMQNFEDLDVQDMEDLLEQIRSLDFRSRFGSSLPPAVAERMEYCENVLEVAKMTHGVEFQRRAQELKKPLPKVVAVSLRHYEDALSAYNDLHDLVSVHNLSPNQRGFTQWMSAICDKPDLVERVAECTAIKKSPVTNVGGLSMCLAAAEHILSQITCCATTSPALKLVHPFECEHVVDETSVPPLLEYAAAAERLPCCPACTAPLAEKLRAASGNRLSLAKIFNHEIVIAEWKNRRALRGWNRAAVSNRAAGAAVASDAAVAADAKAESEDENTEPNVSPRRGAGEGGLATGA